MRKILLVLFFSFLLLLSSYSIAKADDNVIIEVKGGIGFYIKIMNLNTYNISYNYTIYCITLNRIIEKTRHSELNGSSSLLSKHFIVTGIAFLLIDIDASDEQVYATGFLIFCFVRLRVFSGDAQSHLGDNRGNTPLNLS